MATPSRSRPLPPGRTPGSSRKVSDSHTLRALSAADTPNPTRPTFSAPRQSMAYPGSAPRALPATPASGMRRRSLKERTPRQVLAAQRAQPKSARKSLGGSRAQGKQETPSHLLRMLSRMEDMPPDTPDEPPSRTSLAPSDRRRSSLLSRPSISAGDTSLPAIPETQPLPTPSTSSAPIASTSSSPPPREDSPSFDPFAKSHSTSFSASYATSQPRPTQPASLPRFKPIDAPKGFVHPHFVPGYDRSRMSMGSPEAGRRMSTATSIFDGAADETANYGNYAQSAGRKSEAFSELERVSLGGQSEGYFAGDRSARASLANSTRQSLPIPGQSPLQSFASGSGSSPNRAADSSLSRISTGADEDVRAFKAFRLSDEEDAEPDEDRPIDYGDEDEDDLVASLSGGLGEVGGIDWDDVLRDVGHGGGAPEDDDRFDLDAVDSDDQDDGPLDQEEDTRGIEQENRAPLATKAKIPKVPATTKAGVARKGKAAAKKTNRFTPSGELLADMPTSKVRAMFEHATGGTFSLSDEGVDAVLDSSHEFFQQLMAEAAAVAHQSGRSSRVDGGDIVVLLYRSGILTPSMSLSALGRQLGFDRELQSILDAESKRFEVRVAKLLAGRRKATKRKTVAAGREKVARVRGSRKVASGAEERASPRAARAIKRTQGPKSESRN